LESADRVTLTWTQWLTGYTALVLTGLTVVWGFERWAGADPYRTIWIFGGTLLCILSSGRPLLWYTVVRNTGWFGRVPERRMRLLLAALGSILLAGGLLLPATTLR
jgi:hypothetical protein